MTPHRPTWAFAILLGLCVAAAAAGETSRGSGHALRRRSRKRSRRRAQGLELGGSLCKSVIAVDGWRRRRRRAPNRQLLRNDGGDNVTFSFGDDDSLLEEDLRLDVGGDSVAWLPDNLSLMSDPNEIILQDDETDAEDTDEAFVCELSDGATLPIHGTDGQIAELRAMLNSGVLVSAESSVEADEIDSNGGCVDGDPHCIEYTGDGSSIEEFVTLPPGGIRLINSGGNGYWDEDRDDRTRRLNKYVGDKKTLLVRVTDVDGLAVPETAVVISDKFFGTSGDKVTTASGFEGCSFGKFRMTHDYEGAIDESLLSAPGVLEVDLPIRLRTSTQEAVRNHLTRAVEQKLGLTLPGSLPGPFNHVVFVVEDCYDGCEYAAYAFVNHWLSLFLGENIQFPGVVMHELGHNLNLAHSGGLDGRTYTDHTCLMGNPLWEDNVGRMCYNPVKNHQMAFAGGWYSRSHIATFDSGKSGGTSWHGKIVGVGEYDTNPEQHPIVLKIETGRGSDWFVGLNRAAGPNSHAVQFQDLVTLYKVKNGNGKRYSRSSLKASLKVGQRATISGFRDTRHDLRILVTEINTSAVPGYAELEVTFGPQTPNPTRQPTVKPSGVPSSSPTAAPSNGPTSAPSRTPTTEPSRVPTALPTSSPTLQYCPPAYDQAKTNYLAGQLVEINSLVFECSDELVHYCNIPAWDESLLAGDENAKEYWDTAWVVKGHCNRTQSPTKSDAQ